MITSARKNVAKPSTTSIPPNASPANKFAMAAAHKATNSPPTAM